MREGQKNNITVKGVREEIKRELIGGGAKGDLEGVREARE